MAQQTLTQLERDITSQARGGMETLALIAVLTGIASTVALIEFGHLRTDSPWMGALLFTFFWIFGIALAVSRLQRLSAIRTRLGTLASEEVDILLASDSVDHYVQRLAKEEKERREEFSVV